MLTLVCCLVTLFLREMAIKFNDYFEFPREFDMAPYTASVLSEVDSKPCPLNVITTATYCN